MASCFPADGGARNTRNERIETMAVRQLSPVSRSEAIAEAWSLSDPELAALIEGVEASLGAAAPLPSRLQAASPICDYLGHLREVARFRGIHLN